MKVLEFKPSVVAASTLLSAAFEFFPVQFPAFRSALASCEFVNEVIPATNNPLFLCYSCLDLIIGK